MSQHRIWRPDQHSRRQSAGQPQKQWTYWVERQHRAIDRVLDVIEAPEADRFDLGDITLACALGYLDFRLPEIDWRGRSSPTLERWFEAIATRPSMIATTP